MISDVSVALGTVLPSDAGSREFLRLCFVLRIPVHTRLSI